MRLAWSRSLSLSASAAYARWLPAISVLVRRMSAAWRGGSASAWRDAPTKSWCSWRAYAVMQKIYDFDQPEARARGANFTQTLRTGGVGAGHRATMRTARLLPAPGRTSPATRGD